MKTFKKTSLCFVLFLAFATALGFCIHFESNSALSAQSEPNLYAVTTKETVTADNLPDYFCLRDENIIYTADQSSMGLCWSFATAKALETTLALATNEVYDISEAWISLCRKVSAANYQMGGGGTFSSANSALMKYGIVLESDLPYENFYNFDDSNYQEYFEYYSKFANKDILKGITNTSIGKNYGSLSYVENLKLHLINNGATYVSFKADNEYVSVDNGRLKMNAYCNNSQGANHGVTVIGWDDDLTITRKDNVTMTGAWICLNSWGNSASHEGMIYIMYEDLSVGSLCGYTYDSAEYDVTLTMTSTTSYVENLYANYAKSTYEEAEVKRSNQGNVFYVNDEIKMIYESSVNTGLLDIVVYHGDTVCNDFSIQKTSRNVTVVGNDVPEGCYKLVAIYDQNQDGTAEETIVKQIFVNSGVNFADITNSCSITTTYMTEEDCVLNSDVDVPSNMVRQPTAYASHNLLLNNLYIPVIADKPNKFYFTFDIGSYSKIASVDFDIKEFAQSPILYISFKNCADANKYSSGTININGKAEYFTEIGKTYTIDMIFYTTDDVEKIISLNFIPTNSEDEDDVVQVNYLTHQTNVADCPKFVYFDGVNDILMGGAKNKPNQYFIGWYKDSEFANGYALVDNYYVITADSVVFVESRNHYYREEKSFSYLTLYAKYEELQPLEVDDTKTLEDGYYETNYYQNIDIASNGSGLYEFTYISGTLPNGLTLRGNIIWGTPTEIGTFEFCINVKDTLLKENKDCTITLKISKKILELFVQNYSSYYGDQTTQITPVVVSGNQRDLLKANLQIECDASSASDAGIYQINIFAQNTNYDLICNNATYTIMPRPLDAEVESFNCVYDGNYHSFDYSISDNVNVTVSYSSDNLNFVNLLAFKDCTNGIKNIYVKFETSNSNYESVIVTKQYSISKRNIVIELLTNELEYNFEEQMPQFLFYNVVNNETISYEVFGIGEEIGTHNLTFRLLQPSSNNYFLETTNFEYSITKITPTITIPVIEGYNLTAKKYSDIVLPHGFVWQNPEQELQVGENIGYCTFVPENTEIYNVIDNIAVSVIKADSSGNSIIITIVIITIIAVIFVGIISYVVYLIKKRNALF